ARDGRGVVSAASISLSVIGGLNSLDPEALVQALLDADVCAELPPPGKFSEISSKRPQTPQAASVTNDNWYDSRDDAEKAPLVYGTKVGEEVVPAVREKGAVTA
ncbi:unnamed protein product, partial [Laminaria digitata]